MRNQIKLNTPAEIAESRAAGKLAAQVLAMLVPHVKAGVTTDELDRLCNDYIVNVQKAVPANVGYHGFPKTVCASVNDVVCHGIPSGTPLKDGDIVNLDIAVIKDGWFGDTSRMYVVGEATPEAQHLIKTTYEAMCAGIRAVRPGRRWAISAMRSRAWRRRRASAWCASIAAMALARSITMSRRFCITAFPIRA